MDSNNFMKSIYTKFRKRIVPYNKWIYQTAINDKKYSFLLSFAKSNLDIVENTLSKPQETLEFKMTKQKESFAFDVPLELPEQKMIEVTSLEVYITVYTITEKNNKLEILINEKTNNSNH